MKKREKLGKDRLAWIYTQMVRIREFEEAVKRAFIEHPGAIRGHARFFRKNYAVGRCTS